MRHLALALSLAMFSTVSCSGEHNPLKHTPTPPGHELIFYGRGVADTTFTHLFVVNADGTGLYQLTRDSLNDSYPRWSPDGSKIAFLREYGGSGESTNVTVLNTDGTNMTRLTRDIGDANPSWSSDGTLIAYQYDSPYNVPLDVWVMTAGGSGQHLYMNTDSTGSCRDVTLTRRDTLIGDEVFGLWMQPGPTATSMTRIFQAQALPEADPRLSPDGSRVAFSWGDYYGTQGPFIQTVGVDGANLEQLTHGVDRSPAWSPDGTRIAYVSGGAVWVMNANGTSPRQVTAATAVHAISLGDWK